MQIFIWKNKIFDEILRLFTLPSEFSQFLQIRCFREFYFTQILWSRYFIYLVLVFYCRPKNLGNPLYTRPAASS